MKVLLIEDDKGLCYTLGKLFTKNGITSEFANEGDTGYWMGLNGTYDVIILDILLPEMSGFEVLNTLRKQGNTTPVLMLTTKEEIEDKCKAFEQGADDYLVKPFSYQELLLRIGALTRRSRNILDDSYITAGNTRINRFNLEVMIGGTQVKLSLKGANLLDCLMKNKGKFVSKEMLLNSVWGIDKAIQSNSVEVYIHMLRRAFPPEASGFTIETRLGYGYRIVEEG